MSIALLQRPRTHLHDIADDLQSVFWVLLDGCARRFVVGPATLPHDIFVQRSLDIDGLTVVGGKRKQYCLINRDPARVTFTSPALRSLAVRCCEYWSQYISATRRTPPRDLPDVMVVRAAAI